MQLSLADFLRTGRWGDIAAGATKQEIEALLGSPLQTGGTSRKHRAPSLWIRLHFGDDGGLVAIGGPLTTAG